MLQSQTAFLTFAAEAKSDGSRTHNLRTKRKFAAAAPRSGFLSDRTI